MAGGGDGSVLNWARWMERNEGFMCCCDHVQLVTVGWVLRKMNFCWQSLPNAMSSSNPQWTHCHCWLLFCLLSIRRNTLNSNVLFTNLNATDQIGITDPFLFYVSHIQNQMISLNEANRQHLTHHRLFRIERAHISRNRAEVQYNYNEFPPAGNVFL